MLEAGRGALASRPGRLPCSQHLCACGMPNGGHACGVGGPRRWRGPPVATGSARARARAWLRAWLRALGALPGLALERPTGHGMEEALPRAVLPTLRNLGPAQARASASLPAAAAAAQDPCTGPRWPPGRPLAPGARLLYILARSRRVCCGSHTIQPALKAAAAGSTACTAATATLGAPRWALPTRQTPLDQVLLSSSCCFSPPSRESDHILSHAATHTCTMWPVLLLAA